MSLLVGVICIITFFLFTGVECNDTSPEEDKCGEFKSEKDIWNTNNFYPSLLGFYYRKEGDSAVYTFTVPSRENVCPFKHVDVRIDYSIRWPPVFIWPYHTKSEILYGVLYSYRLNKSHWSQISGDEDHASYRAEANFGIKPSAGENPGWYKPFFEIWIKSSGDEVTDHENFQSTVTYISIECDHYDYKEPSVR